MFTYANRHMQTQAAHVSVDGPVFVFVGTWCWQLKQVSVTGESLSSEGTTSWVATGAPPEPSAVENCKDEHCYV